MTVLASQHLYRLTSQWKHPLKWKEKVRTARLEMLIDNIDCRAFVVQAFPTLLSFCSPPRPYVSRVTVLASQHLYRLTSQWKHPLKWKEKVRTARLEMLYISLYFVFGILYFASYFASYRIALYFIALYCIVTYSKVVQRMSLVQAAQFGLPAWS